MKAYDAIVVGAGVMGAATARALATAGKRVLLLEQFDIGHKRGSSHGATRIFRYSYRDPVYVEMAMEAQPLWRRLERENGETLLSITGGLDTGAGLQENAAALESAGADFELVAASEAARRWPALHFSDDRDVLFQPDAGTVAAERSVRSLIDLAVAAGAEVQENARVSAVRDVGGAEVDYNGETVGAEVAVVTAGSWAKGLLKPAGIELDVRPSRETVAYFHHEGPPPLPVCDWGTPTKYALPSPGQGIKAGEHIAGPTTDPDQQGTPNQDSIARVAAWVGSLFKGVEAEPHFAETCLYTNTSDERFVLERHGSIVVGSPCSGHGFKFAPLIGRRLGGLAFPELTS